MKTFFHVEDIGDLNAALKEAEEVKKNRFAWKHLGQDKTISIPAGIYIVGGKKYIVK